MFGAHLSIAEGLHNALISAEKLGLETCQIFTANSRTWSKNIHGLYIQDLTNIVKQRGLKAFDFGSLYGLGGCVLARSMTVRQRDHRAENMTE